MDAGSTTNVDLSFTNTGSLTWPAAGSNPVRASYHWRNGSCASLGAYAVFEGLRTALPGDLPTSASAQNLAVQVMAPASPGTYCLEYDLEHAGITWFSTAGASTLRATVNVNAIEVTCADGEFRAQYFANITLSGAPVVVDCEPAPINHDWGVGGPPSLPANNFSVRWEGAFNLSAGTYTFSATADDGVRVWLDGAMIINAWIDQGPTTYTATRTITAGSHEIRMEYYERGGGAVARLSWSAPEACSATQLTTEYFANRTLTGSPALVTCDAPPVNKNWTGSPAAGLPADNFSVRWAGIFNLEAATYVFTATADDGVRVWLDDVLIIDAWVDQGPTTYTATRTVTAGPHSIRMEYYERGGGAVAQFSWAQETACTSSQFTVEYFANRTLSGSPTLVTCEAPPVSGVWTGSPAPGLPPDNFSIRWAGSFDLAAATYTFTATGDDGVRVWLDNELIIDAWVDQGPTTYTATRAVTAGSHAIRMEYYEHGGGAVIHFNWSP
jgi:hypothetical protein